MTLDESSDPTPRRRRGRDIVVEAAVVVVLAWVLALIATLVSLYALGFPADPRALFRSAPGVSWRFLIWIVLIAVVAWRLRSAPTARRAVFFAAATVAAAVLGLVIDLVIAATTVGSPWALVIQSVSATLPFLLDGVVASFAVPPLLARFGTPARRPVPAAMITVVVAVFLVAGAALLFALFPQWLQVNLSFEGPAAPPTDYQVRRYLLTASFGVGLPLAALILAFATGRRALGVTAIVVVAVGLLAAVALHVLPPAAQTQAPTHGSDPNSTPCYSSGGHSTCPGG